MNAVLAPNLSIFARCFTHHVDFPDYQNAELIEIEPLPLQDWIHGIAIQPDPEQEIRTTEATLHVFQKIDAEARLALEQRRLQKQPWVAWRLYPAVLKVNINA